MITSRAGEERVQTRALDGLSLGVVQQRPKTLSTLDPSVVLRSEGAQAECRLEGAVAETAEARQDCAFLRSGRPALSAEYLDGDDRCNVGLKASSRSDDQVGWCET
jgi:hypothetical protein